MISDAKLKDFIQKACLKVKSGKINYNFMISGLYYLIGVFIEKRRGKKNSQHIADPQNIESRLLRGIVFQGRLMPSFFILNLNVLG